MRPRPLPFYSVPSSHGITFLEYRSTESRLQMLCKGSCLPSSKLKRSRCERWALGVQQQEYRVLAQKSGSGLSIPAISGIVVASAALLLLLSCLVLRVLVRRRRVRKSMPPFQFIEVADLNNPSVCTPSALRSLQLVHAHETTHACVCHLCVDVWHGCCSFSTCSYVPPFGVRCTLACYRDGECMLAPCDARMERIRQIFWVRGPRQCRWLRRCLQRRRVPSCTAARSRCAPRSTRSTRSSSAWRSRTLPLAPPSSPHTPPPALSAQHIARRTVYVGKDPTQVLRRQLARAIQVHCRCC